MLQSVVAISAGASAGAVLRWGAGIALNSIHPLIPLGTLAVNLAGGYLIGLALSFFAFMPSIGAEWRLLIITGFLGGLTTFSTFSGEVVMLLQQQKFAAAGIVAVLHVGGSIVMTFLGMGSFMLVKGLLSGS